MRQKKLFLALLVSMLSGFVCAQSYDLNLSAKILHNNSRWEWKKNDDVEFTKIILEVEDVDGYIKERFYLVDEQGNRGRAISTSFDFSYQDIQQMWNVNIINNVISNIEKKGFQYELRKEMEDDALNYINKVKSYGLEFDDPYLETYIYSLVAKIAPTQLIDGRPGSINLLIQQNPSINACCYPNGTIVLNTGLLAVLHSEDELVAILAHEIAHFILDHSVQNVNAAVSRQKRAEFWAAVATGITAVAEGYAASQNAYYVPGAATIGMAVMASSIASQVVDRLGMNYNHLQEVEADKLAIEALKILGYNENALATALSRLEGEYIKERNNAMYINSYTHPALVERIEKAGVVYESRNEEFEQIISFAVSNTAMMKYSDRRFRLCLPYVIQNIENRVATADDYILKANCLLCTQNDEKSNHEVLELINQAKLLDSENINIYKTEIIATLRINDKAKAFELLEQYIAKLSSYNLDNIKSENTWDNMREFIIAENTWANKMRIKLSGMWNMTIPGNLSGDTENL